MAEKLTDKEMTSWQPQAFAARASQNVTFWDFVKRCVFHLLVGGASGSAVGFVLDKTLRQGKEGRLYTQIGGLVGVLVGSFFTWAREEKSRLEVDQVYRDYKDMPGLRRSNEEIKTDNDVLRKMVSYQQQKLAGPAMVHADSIAHEGQVEAGSHSREMQ